MQYLHKQITVCSQFFYAARKVQFWSPLRTVLSVWQKQIRNAVIPDFVLSNFTAFMFRVLIADYLFSRSSLGLLRIHECKFSLKNHVPWDKKVECPLRCDILPTHSPEMSSQYTWEMQVTTPNDVRYNNLKTASKNIYKPWYWILCLTRDC
jgi:hypothetical protein